MDLLKIGNIREAMDERLIEEESYEYAQLELEPEVSEDPFLIH